MKRKNLDNALELFNKSLDICKNSGDKDTMAYQYRNIGLVYLARGDRETAATMYNNSLLLFQEVGVTKMVEEVQERLNKLQ